jgi:ligand-binding sensor domain-containing protein/DNA-binding CsgD family transcriptional regulator
MRLVIVFILVNLKVFGQNTIGLPEIINFEKKTYKGGLQNWDIKQDQNGIVYIANNEGLLSFDGTYWNLFPLPNKTIVRSVELVKDNRIFVGGQDEMGFFKPSAEGVLKYRSLIQFIAEKDRLFGDVWDIVSYKNDIVFRTSYKIFKFSNGLMTSYEAPSEWSYLGVCGEELYAHDFKKGIYIFENKIWKPIGFSNILSVTDPVTGMLQSANGNILITTLKNGIYQLGSNGLSKLPSSNNAFFEKSRIYTAARISEERFALGTNNAGVQIIDQSGAIVQTFGKNDGLQHENVLSVYLDKGLNLWVGLDNGIDFISYNNAIKFVNPTLQKGAGYAAIIHKNKLFVGTSGGLFSTVLQDVDDLSFSRGFFLPVANTAGQNWSLAEINDQLLLGHHEGVFVIKNNTAIPISTSTGFWSFQPLESVFPSIKTISGNYQGVTFLKYSNGTFTISDTVQNFSESSRYIAIDRFENIWVSHPYHGVYKLAPQKNGRYLTKLYGPANGLPSLLNNHVYKVKNEVVIATEKGVYVYNYSKDSFEPSAFYKKILNGSGIRYLKEDNEGNIWFVRDKSMGVIDMSEKQPVVIRIPELNNELLSGFEFIYTVDKKNILISGEKGFFHINYEKYKKMIYDLNVQIRNVRIVNKKDSLLFGGFYKRDKGKSVQGKESIPSIPHKWKTIRFEYSSPLLSQRANLEYAFMLEGFEENWSVWTKKTEKEYTNLPGGRYNFMVKVRNNLGNESIIDSYAFVILPPWYQTTWAYLFYLIVIVGGIYVFYKKQKRKFLQQQKKSMEEQEKMQYMYHLELDKAEKELIALRNEKLQSEIEFKNSELAIGTMHLLQRGELLNKIKSDLNNIMNKVDDAKVINELKKMIKTLSDDQKMDEDWEHFAEHFDKIHSDFIVKLKEAYPDITPNELKLCTYLRMNLSSKEIAQLMNISVRGVEIGRYRLRKKLGISTETNLFDFLINIQTKS